MKHELFSGREMQSVPELMPAVASADAVIVTDHSDYDYPSICEAASLIVDTRNARGKPGKDTPRVVRL